MFLNKADCLRMPVYTYLCQKCGIEGELLAKIGERDDQKCPDCKRLLNRLPDAPAFSVKDGTPTFYKRSMSQKS